MDKWVWITDITTYPEGDTSLDFCSLEGVPEVGVFSAKVAFAFKTVFPMKIQNQGHSLNRMENDEEGKKEQEEKLVLIKKPTKGSSNSGCLLLNDAFIQLIASINVLIPFLHRQHVHSHFHTFWIEVFINIFTFTNWFRLLTKPYHDHGEILHPLLKQSYIIREKDIKDMVVTWTVQTKQLEIDQIIKFSS